MPLSNNGNDVKKGCYSNGSREERYYEHSCPVVVFKGMILHLRVAGRRGEQFLKDGMREVCKDRRALVRQPDAARSIVLASGT